MTIPTLASNLFLYHVHRNKGAMMLAHEKRRAALFFCGITAAISIASTIWIVYA
jgi:hypothetical protein